MSAEAAAPELSIVVPVYNEEENLRPLVEELRTALDPLRRPYEILLVDDGSADASPRMIDGLAAEDPRIRTIHFRRNCGQTAAFDAGFRKARGQVVITMDADLQNDPFDIPRLLDRLDHPERCDAVVGWRRQRRDTLVRRVSSKVGNAVRNSLSGDSIRDTGCSLKAFRRECLAGLKLYKGMHRFLPTLLRMEGFRVAELPVGHRERRAGISKYGISNRALRGLIDLLAVRWMMRRRLDYTIVSDDGIDHAE